MPALLSVVVRFDARICSAPFPSRRTEETHDGELRRDHAPRARSRALLELDGISRASVEAHYRLYQGYVAKRNEILGALGGVDLGAANQVYSEIRALKVDLTFAIGGIKNHELYFEHLGGEGGDPDGAFGALVERDFGSVDAWRADLRATGDRGARLGVDGLRLGRAAASSTTSATPRTRSRSGTRRRSSRSTSTSTRTSSTTRPTAPSYVDAFFENLDWDVVNGWIASYSHPVLTGLRPRHAARERRRSQGSSRTTP